MKRPRFLYMVIVLGLFSVSAGLSSLTSFAEIIDTSHQGKINEQIVTTVTPREIDDVLYNPGIGFADFHFGFGDPPSLDEYPRQTVAYFRWAWADSLNARFRIWAGPAPPPGP